MKQPDSRLPHAALATLALALALAPGSNAIGQNAAASSPAKPASVAPPELAASMPTTRPMIDFSCVAKEARACGFSVRMPDQQKPKVWHYKLGHAKDKPFFFNALSPIDYGNAPGVTACISGILADPPAECVQQVYAAEHVEQLLADLEKRSRKREHVLCTLIANVTKVDCPQLAPAPEESASAPSK